MSFHPPRRSRFERSSRFQGGNNRHSSGTPRRNPDQELFLSRTSIDPRHRLRLENGSSNPTVRAMDLLCPIGKGQRGLIVSPPKAGKTTFLKDICNALSKTDPSLKLHCLLIDERPEEVTDFRRSVTAEVHASSSDRSYDQHIRLAEDLMNRVLPDVNRGGDVVILLDSLTRLSRVHNSNAAGNKTMSGGLDSRALEVPRRFFGFARNIEEGGSLTILATILVGTGSRMDDVIFQEFKGTGNMELVLSRPAAEQRIFPAIQVHASGTRKEELLMEPDELQSVYKLRRALSGVDEIQAASIIVDGLRQFPTNKGLLASLK